MKKSLLLLLIPLSIFAQKEIQVSEDYITILIFPSPIDTQILGNEQEYFIKQSASNAAVSRYMLSLSYIKIDNVEKNTNLTVFTKDGNSYSFTLKYFKKPNKLDPYYITLDQRSNITLNPIVNNKKLTTVKVKDSYYTKDVITKENTISNTEKSLLDQNLYLNDKTGYIAAYSKTHNNTPKRIFKTYDKSNNIKLTLKNISFDKDELYFHFSILNNGGQTFDVDFINTRLTRDYKGEGSDQAINLTPLFIYNKPKRVSGKSTEDFTMVFKKFTINDKKEFQIDLAEKEGERDLLLHINSKIINNPIKL